MEGLQLPQELREAFQSLLKTAISLAKPRLTASDGPAIPDPSGLLSAIYFTRAFVPTYYIPVACAVLIACLQQWYKRSTRREPIERSEKVISTTTSSPSSSSASSTLIADDETLSTKDVVQAERTPLLGTTTSESHTWFTRRVLSRIASFLTYQPTPIPALTARSNVLPSNGTSLIIIGYALVNIFYLLYNIPFGKASVFATAHRAGLLFVVNLPILYVLGAKNNQPLKWLTGWTYERINIYHRRLGEWLTCLAIIHFTGMVLTWYELFKPLGYSLEWFLSQPVTIFGIGTLLSFLIVWATSIGWFREKMYELFLVVHIAVQLLALILLFLHHPASRPYCGAALAVWILDRGVSRILMSTKKFIATLEIAEDKNTVLLYCDISLDRSKRGDIRSGWKAGQHVFLTVAGMKWYHAKQAHPFTIASPAPPKDADGGQWPLQLIIRCQDGFSKELLEHAKFHQHVEILLDGPYGSSEFAEDILSADRVCLIAGGSGISLTYPLAWSLWTVGKPTAIISSRTVYSQGKKMKKNVLVQSQSSDRRAAHIWIRQNHENNSWITMFPPVRTDTLAPAEQCQDISAVDLVSQRFETRENDEGRPDVATEIRRWLKNGTTLSVDQRRRVCLVVCGPDGLVRDVRNCAALFVREGHDVELHVEKFGW